MSKLFEVTCHYCMRFSDAGDMKKNWACLECKNFSELIIAEEFNHLRRIEKDGKLFLTEKKEN